MGVMLHGDPRVGQIGAIPVRKAGLVAHTSVASEEKELEALIPVRRTQVWEGAGSNFPSIFDSLIYILQRAFRTTKQTAHKSMGFFIGIPVAF